MMELQRQHFLLSYFKTLSVGPAGVELTTSHVTAWCSTHWDTGAWWVSYLHKCANKPNGFRYVPGLRITNDSFPTPCEVISRPLANNSKHCDNSSPSSHRNHIPCTNKSLEEFKDIFGRYCAEENDEWKRFYATNFQENLKLLRDAPPLHVFPKIGFEAR